MSDDSSPTKQFRFTLALLKWFRKNKRKFPWRVGKATAYKIALAEALLQKTNAVNVRPVYERVLTAYPTVTALAAADKSTIAQILQPLGLPRRAGLLHQLAKEIVKRGGRFPQTEKELRQLPGIGPYGAGAIASQVFKQRAPMIDINVMRIFHRVFSTPFIPRNGPSQALRQLALALMPAGKEVAFNLALLDFGALVCSTRNPQHDNCPMADFCDYNLARLATLENTEDY